MKIRALLVILLTLACAGAYAQDGGVKGKVVSRDGRVALSNVKVVVEPLGVTVMTDNHGNFNIDQLPKGEYQLKFEAPEFENLDLAVRVDKMVKNLVVQPTHLMHGAEYDEMCEAIEQYKDKFESVSIAEPLLGEVGSDATVINADKEAVAKAITAAAVADAGFESLDAAKDAGTAFVFMGHGTAHVAKVTYSQMQTQMQNLGYENVFIGTVEGEPEETACEAVIEAVKAAGYTNVVLRPLMVVAGDHANNDMAGSEEDSWKTMFEAAGFTVDCQIHGLGEIADVQALYVAHTKAAIDSLNA